MNYNFRNIFKQQPSSISAVVMAALNIVVLAGIWKVSKDVILAIDAAVPLLLSLFYIRPLTVSRDSLDKLSEVSPAPSEFPDYDVHPEPEAGDEPLPAEDSVGRIG